MPQPPEDIVIGMEIAGRFARAAAYPYPPLQPNGPLTPIGTVDMPKPFADMQFDDAKIEMIALLRQLIDRIGNTYRVQAIGIALTDPVTNTGTIARGTQHHRWQNINVIGELNPLISPEIFAQRPVIAVGNDADLAALAVHREEERQHTGGNYALNKVYIFVGAGIGAGFIINGEMYTGEQGYAGEIGHTPFDPHSTQTCPDCRRMGCLELYASGLTIARKAIPIMTTLPPYPTHDQDVRAAEQWGVLFLEDDRKVSAWQVYKLAEGGDPAAQAIITECAANLGSALVTIAQLLNPYEIILGGLGAKGLYYEEANHIFTQRSPSTGRTHIGFDPLRQEAPMIGAALSAIKKWLHQ